ncbi:MAG: SIMPL domain-containing protein [Anaerolineaceae bacterium]|nr:SIMPL domain-containing protein [Anaerolineaceae bacterium]MDE0327645.1 SIMPL domain-containing protein [Anaerolineaceae bacterium]
MKRMLLTLTLLLTLVTAAQAQEAWRALTVTGSGSAGGAPDMALVRLGVQTSDEDVLAAFDRSNQITADIVEALLELGIERADIQTSGLSLYQDRPYDPYSDVEDGTIIYWAQNTLSVTLRDVTLVGQALGVSVQAGANSIDRLSYGISDPAELEARARELAVADARARAEHLAELTGAQLGRVFSINESDGGFRTRAESLEFAAMAADAGGTATVEAGQLSVSVQLQITWELQ